MNNDIRHKIMIIKLIFVEVLATMHKRNDMKSAGQIVDETFRNGTMGSSN